MSDSPDSLRLEEITVAFQGATGIRKVLTGVSVALRPGDWVAVVGRNGSGKSTLARVAAGLLPVSSGRIRRSTTEERRIGVVLQNPDAQLIGTTVWEDVCFGMETAGIESERMPETGAWALAMTGLAGLEERAVDSLSGGQKQLLAFAGALAAGAGLFVFDEATAMLDPLSAERVLAAAEEQKRRGSAVLWVTQRLEELAFADRVLALDEGRTVYEGTAAGFFYGEEAGLVSSLSEAAVMEQETGDERPAGSIAGMTTGPHSPDNRTPCERLGFPPPYVVRTAQELLARGVPLGVLPLTTEELADALPALGDPGGEGGISWI
ncbi:hypothetical protein J31TS4_36400 [Paenibacillus sp. J31TS4]|uniref:ATP-binding cassette domain-containing protein n=1 Tax=Paenibacillus sp. J31TS4 TaxID=2807195 RepID=UPI001B04D201|nr:ATP-binding cassette domain-containing protein [Paenibacillus sp. J31TS4]GIP40360.1 hypothetical protein J31TS4_36400 [Paenibacillus sp. J31TS4]